MIDSRALRTLCAVSLMALMSAARGAGPDPVIGGFLDGNRDGRISYDEFVHSMTTAVMRELDKDGNGALTPDEVTPARASAQAGAVDVDVSRADSDGDGKVSQEELKRTLRENAGVRSMFRRYDTNGDGVLDPSELGDVRGLPQLRLHY